MTPIRILTLGTFLLLHRDLYGYEIRRELEEWGAERWANISYSSLYLTLGKLVEAGLLAEVGVEQPGKQPARTKYSVTTQGEAEFRRWLREYWAEPKPVYDPFQIALTFMPLLSQSDLLDALAERSNTLLNTVRDLQNAMPSKTYRPQHIQGNIDLLIAHLGVELAHIESIVSRIKSGER